MLPPETAWVDVERVGDLEFMVHAAGRDGTIGLRLVGATTNSLSEGRVALGRLVVEFDVGPIDVADRSKHGHCELALTWSGETVDLRVSIAG
jgi:hypothetical protein